MENRMTKIENLLIDVRANPDDMEKFCDTIVEVAQLYSDYKKQQKEINILTERVNHLEDTFLKPNIK